MLAAFVIGFLVGGLIAWVVFVAPLHERLESFEQAVINAVHQTDTLTNKLDGHARAHAEKISADLTDVLEEESHAEVSRSPGDNE